MRRIAAFLLFSSIAMSFPAWAGEVKQLAQLRSPDFFAEERFGSAVAIAASTVVVGAYDERDGVGHAYVYTEAGGPSPVATFTDNTLYAGFGYAVAISNDGSTIVVGSPGPLAARRMAYVFVKPAGGWQNMSPTAALSVPQENLSLGAGVSVSSDGSTVAVGAQGYDGNGRIFVFTRPVAGWQNQTMPSATLVGTTSGAFGASVSMTDDTIVAGSLGEQAPGAACIYVRPPTGWQNAQPTATLTSSDGNAGDQFGFSVVVFGNTVVVGAPTQSNSGAAYIFVEPPGGWQNATQTAKLSSADQGRSLLGYSVALAGNAVLAGAPDTTLGQNPYQGSVAVYLEPAGGWADSNAPDLSITASDGATSDLFGWSVGTNSTTAVVGAPGHTVMGRSGAGGAWVFSGR